MVELEVAASRLHVPSNVSQHELAGQYAAGLSFCMHASTVSSHLGIAAGRLSPFPSIHNKSIHGLVVLTNPQILPLSPAVAGPQMTLQQHKQLSQAPPPAASRWIHRQSWRRLWQRATGRCPGAGAPAALRLPAGRWQRLWRTGTQYGGGLGLERLMMCPAR